MSASAYLGPGLVCSFAQAVETGGIFGQLVTFWSLAEPTGDALRCPRSKSKRSQSDGLPPIQACPYEDAQVSSGTDFWGKWSWKRVKKFPSERVILKVVAIYTFMLTLVQLTFTLLSVWHALVINWGKLEAALSSVWAARTTQMVVSHHGG